MIEKIYQSRKKDFIEKKIKVVKYKDDINKFINIYEQMEYMICERFHSLILSYVFQQKFFVISYSKKIDNVISELGLCEKYIKFEDITKENELELKSFNIVEKNKLKELRKKAEKQFEKLDEYMKG